MKTSLDLPSPTGDDTSSDVPAGEAGDFGVGNFFIEMDVRGRGVNAFERVGALFLRANPNYPYEGPSAFILENGNVMYRIHGEEPFIYENALPDIANSMVTRHLKFSRRGNKLLAEIDGKKYENTTTKEIGTAVAEQLKTKPLRFRGNHVNKSFQWLNVDVTNITFGVYQEGPAEGVSSVSTRETGKMSLTPSAASPLLDRMSSHRATENYCQPTYLDLSVNSSNTWQIRFL